MAAFCLYDLLRRVTMENQVDISPSENPQRNFTWKNFWALLSRPLKALFSIFGLVTGAGLIGLATTLTGVMATLENGNKNSEIWVKSLVVFVMVVLVCLFVLTILLATGFMRVKFMEDDVSKKTNDSIANFNAAFEENVQKFNNSIHKLNESITQFSLAKYIKDKREISELEKNACGKKIIVMSSKFNLDTGDLQKIILDNLRKGITYVYLIPEQDSPGYELDLFRTMVTSWWNTLEASFFKEKPQTFMDADYKQILGLVKSATREEVLGQLRDYFCKHIQFVMIAKEYGIVTVVMYQRENDFQWDTIIMLPINDNDDYYAFQIPDAEGAEKKELEKKIRTLSLKCQNFSF